MAPVELTVCLLMVVASGVLCMAADSGPGQEQQRPVPAAAPLQLNPDAEGTAADTETSARFLFKKNRRRNNRRYPSYDYNYYYDYNNYDYDYTSQCGSCGYGAVDYSTARRCCQQGYSRCCFNSGNSEKSGTCPPFVLGGGSGSYCRQECNRDSDCYGTQKCCSQGCSRACRHPGGGGGNGGFGYEKPGSCPYRGSRGSSYPSYPYYSGGTRTTAGGAYCHRDCYSDHQCPGNQKCCENNCSATCVSPQRYY